MPGLGATHAERRDRLIDGAVRLCSGVVLADALAAEEQAGRAVVSARGRDRRVDRASGHHMRPASRGSQRSARSVTLTGWSTTDSTCSCTCWIIDPAYGQNGVVRIILTSVSLSPSRIGLISASST